MLLEEDYNILIKKCFLRENLRKVLMHVGNVDLS